MNGLRKGWVTLILLGVLAGARAGTLVQFQLYFGVFTYIGEVDVELYNQDKPITTKNFINLIQAGDYTGGFFHRLQPGFVLQGGGYSIINPTATSVIAPPFTNVSVDFNFGNITNEIFKGKFYSNTNGTIAMAKTSDPNSANSQFFFNLADNAASLDNTNNAGGFTVFGTVVRGLSIIDTFNGFSKGNGVVDLTDTYGTNGFFTQLPTSQGGTNPPPYEDLVYYTVNVLTTQIKLQTNGARQISWTTVSGVTNNLEYATNLSGSWSVLASVTNATGAAVNVTDSSTNKTRYYRVHVLF